MYNILLISIDTCRADHLSCYGYHRPTTPNLERLAEDGVIYKQHYSTGVWTPPGHASMLTGLYVSEHGVYDENRLADEIPTIATILKQHGYQTAGFVNNSQVGELVGFNKGHDLFVEVWKGVPYKNQIERIIKGGYRRLREYLGYEDMGAKRTNRLFSAWINTIDKDKPFYCFLHYIEPHNPLNPPKPFKKRFLRGYKNINKKNVSKVAHNPLICYVEDINLNEDEVSFIKDLYDGELAYTDHIIGEVISILKDKNLYDNTMIIITSDHGEHFGEHGCWSHVASLYKEVLHIPLIIKYPSDIDMKGEKDGYTQLVDLLPTVLDLTNISADGIKLSGLSLLANNGNNFHEYIFAEWEGRVPYFIRERLKDINSNEKLKNIKSKLVMIQDHNFKILKKENEEKIFELVKEDSTIYNIKKSNRINFLRIELNKFKTDLKSTTNKSQINSEIVKNLKALGYM